MPDTDNADEVVNPQAADAKSAAAPDPEPDEVKPKEEQGESEDSSKPKVGPRAIPEVSPMLGESGLKRLGEVRDGLLVAASLLYTLGYVVRSINAWQHKIGLLPAIQAQYFVAGVGPALIIVFAYGLLLSVRARISRENLSVIALYGDLFEKIPGLQEAEIPKSSDRLAFSRWLLSNPITKSVMKWLLKWFAVTLIWLILSFLAFIFSFIPFLCKNMRRWSSLFCVHSCSCHWL